MRQRIATIDNVRKGSIIVPDDRFYDGCLEPGGAVTVDQDDKGLFVPCAEGKHYLDGQLEDGEAYLGFTLADAA